MSSYQEIFFQMNELTQEIAANNFALVFYQIRQLKMLQQIKKTVK
jgi:hypothetical protein